MLVFPHCEKIIRRVFVMQKIYKCDRGGRNSVMPESLPQTAAANDATVVCGGYRLGQLRRL